MKRLLTLCTVVGLICIHSGYAQAEWHIIQFSEEDLWNNTPNSDTRLYNQDAPRRHHTNWKADIQTTDSTQPNQSEYQTTTGTNGWFQTDTYDNWLSAGPIDNFANDFGICEVQLWGAGYPNGRLAFNERFRVNGGAEAWVILATPAGWTGFIEDNPWDDDGTGMLDQYWAVWRADSYVNRILYSASGDGVDDYVFMLAVDIIGEYATILEPSPDGNPFEDDGSLRFWFGGYVLDPNPLDPDNPFTNEGYDGVITTSTLVLMDVQIDIMPDSDTNPVNLGSKGVIPVAILSSPDFDATTVLPESVEVGGAGVAVRGKGKLMAHDEDVNGDGLIDKVIQVETETAGSWTSGDVILTGETSDGLFIQGSDVVVIVPQP